MDFWHWLAHFTGSDDPSGHWYTFWSGFGADLGQVALLGAGLGIYRKHNCHVHRCWRIAKQDVEGTSWKVCHKHHPEGKPTVASVAQAHSDHKARIAAGVHAVHTAEAVAVKALHPDPPAHGAATPEAAPEPPPRGH